RHVGRLEKRLGVRLLERSTRHFRLTDVGEHYYAKAREILAELTAADTELAEMRSAPCGVVRLAAPLATAQYVLPLILPAFMARHPLIKLQVIVSDKPVDLVADKVDIAIRARTALGNEALTMKKLTSSYRVLVASPAFAAEHKVTDLKCLSALPFLSSSEIDVDQSLTLVGSNGKRVTLNVTPRLMTTDFNLVREAAIAGQGIGFLPIEVVSAAIGEGRLQRVLPDWQSEKATIHLVFAGQKSLTPAGRLLVDYLADQFEPMIRRHGLAPG